jgi:hypothetical protein
MPKVQLDLFRHPRDLPSRSVWCRKEGDGEAADDVGELDKIIPVRGCGGGAIASECGGRHKNGREGEHGSAIPINPSAMALQAS